MEAVTVIPDRRSHEKGVRNRKLWEIGGIVAGVVLIAFGAASIWMGASGVNTVRDNLAREQIEGTGETSLDGYTVAEGELVNTGSEARAFADLMGTHALEGSGGLVYADMGRFRRRPTRRILPVPAIQRRPCWTRTETRCQTRHATPG